MRTSVCLTAFVFIFMFMGISYAEIWYEEDFDDFEDGEVADQDEWETAFGQQSATVQGDVAFGDTGKSLLVVEGTMVVRNFLGETKRAGIQHVSFYSRKDLGDATWMNYYIGGGGVNWGAAAVLWLPPGIVLQAVNGADGTNVAEIKLGEWGYLHVVLDFDSKTFDLYLDGEQVADNFVFRGEARDPKHANPSLEYFFFGEDDGENPLVVYVDNISIGDGEGDPNPPRMAVSSSGKLVTTWAELKEIAAK